jgi:phenylpyruvate tautomerase PptA (4-oxalocrotonate tautomerase family)
VCYVRLTSTPAGRFAQIAAIDRASVNFLSMLSRSVPEHINAVIGEVGLDKWGFAGKLSSERRKQSERNEGDDGRQMGLRTTE